jgi:hypothetical protein
MTGKPLFFGSGGVGSLHGLASIMIAVYDIGEGIRLPLGGGWPVAANGDLFVEGQAWR